jgi:ankyrin repeat and BTB/POZ domain-containing protein 1
MVLRKFEIEEALREENQEISAGRLKEDSPLEFSEGFTALCEAARRGDLKTIHEKISEGVNINARDAFDNTPLILVYAPSRLMDCFVDMDLATRWRSRL